MTAVQAKLRNYRVSARKARLLADQIRGRGVEEALANAQALTNDAMEAAGYR